MKTFLALLAVGTSLLVLTPSASQARDSHGHSSSRQFANRCNSCGTSVYRERVCTGRDRHGCLAYGWRTMSHRCQSSHGHGHGHGHSSHFGHGHSSGSSSHGSHSGRR